MADDALADLGRAVAAAGAHRRDAVDELGLAHRLVGLRPAGAVHRPALHEDGRDDVVALAGIGQQVVQQVAPARPVPEVVVRVDDRQAGVERLLGDLRQPVLADRHVMRIGGVAAHRGFPWDVSCRGGYPSGQPAPAAAILRPSRETRNDLATGRAAGDRGGPGPGGPARRRHAGRHGRRRDQDREAGRRRRRPDVGPALRAGRRDQPLFPQPEPQQAQRRAGPEEAGGHRLPARAVRDRRHPDPEPPPRRGGRDRHRAGGDARAPPAADLLLDLGLRLPGADAAEPRLRPAAAGLWRHDERDRTAAGPADLLRRLDQRQGDGHVLHHRRAGRAPPARPHREGLPGRYLAARDRGALGRGPCEQRAGRRSRCRSATAPAPR